jgi:tetratricopeptide (TPR) repeat protein
MKKIKINMRFICVLMFLSLFVCSGKAQKNKLDSLHNELRTAADTNRVNTLLLISREYLNSEVDSALSYLDKAMVLSEDLDFLKGQKETNVRYAVYYYLKNDFNKSIYYGEKALTVAGLGISNLDGDAHTLIANGYLRKSMYDKAIHSYHLALPVFEATKTKKKIAMVMNNIGNIYFEQERFKEAIPYYTKAIDLRLEEGDPKELITPYNNLGNCYNALKDFDRSLEYQQKGLVLSIQTNTPFNMATCYQDIGAAYYGKGDYDKAIQFKLKALNIFRNTDYLIETTSCFLGIAQTCAQLKNYKAALQYVDSAKVIADSTNFIFNRHLVFENLAEINRKMGNFEEALKYYDYAAVIKDSIVDEQSTKAVSELQAKYESEKKDIEILVQKTEIEKQNTQRNGLIIGASLLLLLLVFILRSFYQKKKDNRIITAQKKEVEHQKALVDEHRKALIDSIHYAERIQKTLMPSEKYIEKNLDRLKDPKKNP